MTSLLYLQQQDTNATAHALLNALNEREKNIAIARRRRQIQNDRKFLARYDPDTDKKFDPVKFDRYHDIKFKYKREKEQLLEFYHNTQYISDYTEYPDFLNSDDFLTYEDYSEVNEARNSYAAAWDKYHHKKRVRKVLFNVLGFIAIMAFMYYVSSGAK